ncbi:MAG TPA: aminotransferase class V-fold PLP-dependent enzyme [Alphaproteobacteria bacterium]|nr:aminotransferase class V-fold PLP-dependent enzyme [Alphaproteobacteria bacterium]
MTEESLDVARLRADTPGCGRVAHLNNCGAGLMPRPVLQALADHLALEAEIGGYEAEAAAEAGLEYTYDAIARLLNCRRDEVAVVENATVAWDMAFYGFPLGPGDVVLTAVSEYASNYIAYLQRQRRDGFEVRVVPNDESGQLDVAALATMIDSRVKLISVTHVPTNGGLVNPAAAIGRVAREAGIPFLLDACQSAGQLPLDVEAIGCDMLTATGRKYLRGPRGTGFLYVRRGLLDRLEPPFLDLHSADWTAADAFEMRPDARRFENWESYVAGKLGLGVAVDYALALGLPAIAARVQALAGRLREGLDALPGVAMRDLGRERSGIVSFTVEGVEPDAAVAALRRQGINISSSGAASTRHDMDGRGLPALCRAGVHYYNDEAELERLLEAVAALHR